MTLGHLSVIERAANVFGELHVLVVHNPNKAALIPFADRVKLIRDSIDEAGIRGSINVTSWSVGLLVDYVAEIGAGVIVKGLRGEADLAYETPMAIVNRDLADVETVFLLPDPAHQHVSSSLVRQVNTLGGDVRPYVPPAVARFLRPGA